MKSTNKISVNLFFCIVVGMFFTNANVQAAKFDLSEPFDEGAREINNFIYGNPYRNRKQYQSILELINKKEFKKAELKINELLNRDSSDFVLYRAKGVLEYLQGRLAEAKKSYKKSIEVYPNNIPAYLGLAKLAMDENKNEDAKEYAQKIIELDKGNADAYIILASLEYKNGDLQMAEEFLKKAYSESPDRLELKIAIAKKLGAFYVSLKKPEKFLELAHEIVKQYPSEKEALSFLAGSQIINKKNKLAERTLLKIISMDKQDVKHRVILAKLLGKNKGNEKEVLNIYNEIIKLRPNEKEPYIMEVAYLTALHRYREAMDIAKQLEFKFPDTGLGEQVQGDIFLAQKKTDLALKAYRQAYKVNSSDKLLYLITDIMNIHGEKDEAIDLLEKELGKNPDNKAIHFKLGSIYQQLGEYGKAVEHFNDILKKQPDNAIVLNNLAWIYAQKNDPQAIVYAEKAYKKLPRLPAIVDTYGYMLVKQGNINQGVSLLERAVRIAPENKTMQFHLAEGYAMSGEQGKAVSILKKLAKTPQTFPEQEQALSLLKQLTAH